MGFRLRRSIRLTKGVRLNVSGGGLSLSLGGKGATVNLSSRGARATLGIPGTGISWSSSASAPRHGIPAEIAALADLAEHADAATLAEIKSLEDGWHQVLLETREYVEQTERDFVELVNYWRRLAPDLPTQLEYKQRLTIRPLEDRQPTTTRLRSPTRPESLFDLTLEQTRLVDETKDELLRERRRPTLTRSLAITAVCVAALAAVLEIAELGANPFLLFVVAVLAFALDATIAGELYERKIKRLIVARASAAWPTRKQEREAEEAARSAAAEQAYVAELGEFEARRAREDAEQELARLRRAGPWFRDETVRTAHARALLDGSLAATREALDQALDAIDFPFAATVDFDLEDREPNCRLVVSLPDVDAVIPQTKLRVQESGVVTQIRRPMDERTACYGELALGSGLAVAFTALAACPFLEAATVAACTRRDAVDGGFEEERFIYEVTISRTLASTIDIARFEPLSLIGDGFCRGTLARSGGFDCIEPPAWWRPD